MNPIPDILGYPLDEAVKSLQANGFDVVLQETLGKNTSLSNDVRVLRQRQISPKQIELTISYF